MSFGEFLASRHLRVKSAVLGAGISPAVILFLNPLNYRLLRGMSIGENVYYAVDGMFLRFLLRRAFVGCRAIRHQAFDYSSIAADVFQWVCKNKLSLYIAGGTAYEVEMFCTTVAARFPTLKLAGHCSGFLEDADIVQAINSTTADVVILGLGNFKQERVALELSDASLRRVVFTCGAFISQTVAVGGGRYYPIVIDRLRLRWLFRCIREPRVIQRILLDYPRFLGLFAVDWLRWKFGAESNDTHTLSGD